MQLINPDSFSVFYALQGELAAALCARSTTTARTATDCSTEALSDGTRLFLEATSAPLSPY